MSAGGVSVKRLLKASTERVFAAWTRPELMALWLFPGQGWVAEVTSDPQVGGRFQLVMKDPSGAAHEQFGEWRELQPNSRLVFTWSCPELGVENSVVTVELAPHGEFTELTLHHELPPDPEIRREHQEGWEGCLNSFEAMLNQQS